MESSAMAEKPFAAPSGKLEVRVLIPLWGSRYIDDFVKFALPSLLAPGNLPLLAGACRVTVVFLTAKKDFAHFRQQPAISGVLASYCKLDFIPIDDLILGVHSYAVPLTLAYLRGMTETGENMTRTYFLCYNADFILADGSLKPVLRHILEGRSVILAPSFRVTAETVKPVLWQQFLRPHGQFSMRPRDMARLAFKDIHPTVISRIVNQDLFHSYYPNQIYWRVDDHTLLARFYLIMQLCIRPERRVESINNFVDYAFLPEMCPSGDMVAISDSDEFFMMELQPTEAENEFIRPGPTRIRHVAKSVSEWTTPRHREISRFELVFHTEDLPESLPEERARLDEFMAKVEARLESKTISHDRHHYWPGAIESWLHARQRPGKFDEEDRRNCLNASRQYFSGIQSLMYPPTLTYYFKIQRWKLLFLGLFWGLPPRVRLWHPQFINFCSVLSWLRRNAASGQARVLYVTDETEFDGFFAASSATDKILPRDLLGGFLDKIAAGSRHSLCFIHLLEVNAHLAKKIVRYIHEKLPHVRSILLYVGQNLVESGLLTMKYTQLSTIVSHFDQSYAGQLRYRFMGGILWKKFLPLFQKIFTENYAGSLGRNFAFAGRLLWGSFFIGIANILTFLGSKNKSAPPQGCTGMMVEIDVKSRSEVSLSPRSSREGSLPVTAVIGTTGFIGRHLWQEFSRRNSKTVGTSRRCDAPGLLTLDLLDPDIRPLDLVKRGVTHAVIAAAVSGIAACERDPAVTRRINVEGTVSLARQLCENGIKVIALSSDYVFDGTTGDYSETSEVLPVNEYGRQKASMEKLLIENCDASRLLILRFSKVFDAIRGSGTLIDEMAGRLSRGKEVRAARDQIFCPTRIEDVVAIIAELIETDARGILHVCSPHKISRLELARATAEAFGADLSLLKDISLGDLEEEFKRPLNTSMTCERLKLYLDHPFKDIYESIEELKRNYEGCRLEANH
jgi:dTDP-4-dehydrorhamnose reductase